MHDPTSFKGLEHAGWQRGAASYDDLFGSVTRHAVEPLLDAVSAAAGTDLLEACCGLGYGAGGAAARGARATGIDFAAAMLDGARARYPNAHFEQGDVESLRFTDATFDAVICAFGVNHLPAPEKAIAEAHRVLRPGGKFAFTMWCTPDKSKFRGLVLDSIRSHGTLDVSLPPAPPPFRFSDPDVCASSLRDAGFDQPRVTEIDLAFRPQAPEQVLELARSAVRMELILAAQTHEARTRIHRAIVEGAERFRIGAGIEIPMPAVLAVGVKARWLAQ